MRQTGSPREAAIHLRSIDSEHATVLGTKVSDGPIAISRKSSRRR